MIWHSLFKRVKKTEKKKKKKMLVLFYFYFFFFFIDWTILGILFLFRPHDSKILKIFS